MDRRTQRTTPSGLCSEWIHDPAGRPTRLSSADGTIAFAYDDAGRETERRIGDATTLTQTWDRGDRLTTQTLATRYQSETDRILQHRTYAYRPDGYLTEIRELTTGTRRFALDPAGRVTGVQTHGWSEKYAYDSTGNHTHAAAPHHPSSGDRAYEGALIRRAGRTTYEHDAAGRLIRKTRKLLNGQTRTWTYTWNPENRLTKSTTLSGEEWTYAYDPLGRRISKTGPDGTPLTFTWDSTQLAEQFASDGTATTWDYAPGTHRPVSQSTRQTLEARTDTANSILDLADTTPSPNSTPASSRSSRTWSARPSNWSPPTVPSPGNPELPSGAPPPRFRGRGGLPAPLPQSVRGRGNRPQLQLLSVLRSRNRPLHHTGPAWVGPSAQRGGVCS